MEKSEPLYTAGGNANLCSHYGKQYGVSLRKLKIELPYDPPMLLLGIYSEETKTLIQKDTCIAMFIAAVFTVAKCPSTDDWYLYTMEYYSVIKMNEILPLTGTWVDLENIIFSDVSHTEKDKYYMI